MNQRHYIIIYIHDVRHLPGQDNYLHRKIGQAARRHGRQCQLRGSSRCRRDETECLQLIMLASKLVNFLHYGCLPFTIQTIDERELLCKY